MCFGFMTIVQATQLLPKMPLMNRMNVRPGGAQPRMQDTYYNSRLPRMVLPDGNPKGMKQVLEENVTKMTADDMRQALQSMPDFKYEKTKVDPMLDSGTSYLNFIAS